MPIFVKKASGKREPFDIEKIRRTSERAGASKQLAMKIAKIVEKKAYDGISTRKILDIILKELDKNRPYVAARYDLKAAIMRLGPAGFPFEQLLAELLLEYGYKTQTHVVVKGGCVKHEIDVVANNKDVNAVIEAKYHNAPGIYTGVKDALYVWARYLDLQNGAKRGKYQKFNEVWLATNTKFSTDAVTYGECIGMRLLGWNYPSRKNLQTMLETKKLYPITAMRSLDRRSLQRLSEAQMMFCKDIITHKINDMSRMMGIAPRKLQALQKEARLICNLK